jgi:hypothetical protein
MLYPQAIFTISAAGGGLYFLLKKRQFDYFSLAYFSALIYFLPGFFGFTSFHASGDWSDASIHPEAYLVMIFVMLSIFVSAFISSRIHKSFNINKTIPAEPWVSRLLMVLTVVGFSGLLASSGSALFQPEKDIVLESLNRWHILFYSAATIGFPIALHKRQHFLAGLFIAFLGFNLFIGFRFSLAISIISALVLVLFSKGKQRLLIDNWKMIIGAMLFGTFMFGYKVIAYAVKSGMWAVVWNRLQDANTYLFMFIRSEPFLVQQTLNEVVTNRFETTADHVISSLYQFILFAPELGAESITFNSLFQPALFPNVEYGLAANIWAQMWSAGGWPLLIVFVLIFNVILALGNSTLRARSAVLKAGLAPVFCYWAFYIHRNELGYALNLEKRLLLLLFFVIVVLAIVKVATRQGSLQQGTSG